MGWISLRVKVIAVATTVGVFFQHMWFNVGLPH